MAETKRVVAYPAEEQYEVWGSRAEEMGYRSTSQFLQDMVEAGSKRFTAEVDPDETNQDLRQHRNELKGKLDKARNRIQELEKQLYNDEQAKIEETIHENPGISFDDIVQEMIDTVPLRVNRHLDDLEGNQVQSKDDSYYPITGIDEK